MVMADDDDEDRLYIDERDPAEREQCNNDQIKDTAHNNTKDLRNIRKNSAELPPVNNLPLMKNCDLKAIQSSLNEENEKPRISCKDFSRIPFNGTNNFLNDNAINPLADLEKFTDVPMFVAEANNAIPNINTNESVNIQTRYLNTPRDLRTPPNAYISNENTQKPNVTRQASVIVPNQTSPSASHLEAVRGYDGRLNLPTADAQIPLSIMPAGNIGRPPPPYRPRPPNNLQTRSSTGDLSARAIKYYGLPMQIPNSSHANQLPPEMATINTNNYVPPVQRPDSSHANRLPTEMASINTNPYVPPVQRLDNSNSNQLPPEMPTINSNRYGLPVQRPDSSHTNQLPTEMASIDTNPYVPPVQRPDSSHANQLPTEMASINTNPYVPPVQRPDSSNLNQLPPEMATINTNRYGLPVQRSNSSHTNQLPTEMASMNTNPYVPPVQRPDSSQTNQLPTDMASINTNPYVPPLQRPDSSHANQSPPEMVTINTNRYGLPVRRPDSSHANQLPTEMATSNTNPYVPPVQRPDSSNLNQLPLEMTTINSNRYGPLVQRPDTHLNQLPREMASNSYDPQRPHDLQTKNSPVTSSNSFSPPKSAQNNLPPPMTINGQGPPTAMNSYDFGLIHNNRSQIYTDVSRRYMYSGHSAYHQRVPSMRCQRPLGPPMPAHSNLHARVARHPPCMECMGMPRPAPPNVHNQGPMPFRPWSSYEQAYGGNVPLTTPYMGRDKEDYLAEMRAQQNLLQQRNAIREMTRQEAGSSSMTKQVTTTTKRSYTRTITNCNTEIVVSANSGTTVNNIKNYNMPDLEAIVNKKNTEPVKSQTSTRKKVNTLPWNGLFPPNMPLGPMAINMLEKPQGTKNIEISCIESTPTQKLPTLAQKLTAEKTSHIEDISMSRVQPSMITATSSSENTTTLTNYVETTNEVEESLVVDLTEDTDIVSPTTELATTKSNTGTQIPLIMDPETNLIVSTNDAHNEMTSLNNMEATERSISSINLGLNNNGTQNALTSQNDITQINGTTTSTYQVKISTTSTTEKISHRIQNKSVSKSDIRNTETDLMQNVEQTTVNSTTNEVKTIEVMNLLSVEKLKDILNTINSIETRVDNSGVKNSDNTVNNNVSVDNTFAPTKTNSCIKTTTCQESEIAASEEEKLKIARMNLARLRTMAHNNEPNINKEVNETVQINTNTKYKFKISTDINGKVTVNVLFEPSVEENEIGQCSDKTEKCSSEDNNEIVLHSQINEDTKILNKNTCIEKYQKKNTIIIIEENSYKRNPIPNIDEFIFFKFQLNFFRLVQERLYDNEYDELAEVLKEDIYDLIEASENEEATADMKYKCHSCRNVTIYSPRELYYEEFNSQQNALIAIQHCPICITFKKKYIEILFKYVEIETSKENKNIEPNSVSMQKDENKLSTANTSTHTGISKQNEKLFGQEGENSIKEMKDSDLENELSMIINGVPSSPKRAKIDDQLSSKANNSSKISLSTTNCNTSDFIVKLPRYWLKESTIKSLVKCKDNANITYTKGTTVSEKIDDNNDTSNNNVTKRNIEKIATNTSKALQTTNIKHPSNNNSENLTKQQSAGTRKSDIQGASCIHTKSLYHNTKNNGNEIIEKKEKHRKRKASSNIEIYKSSISTSFEQLSQADKYQRSTSKDMDTGHNHGKNNELTKNKSLDITCEKIPQQHDGNHASSNYVDTARQQQEGGNIGENQEKNSKRRKSMNVDIIANHKSLHHHNVNNASNEDNVATRTQKQVANIAKSKEKNYKRIISMNAYIDRNKSSEQHGTNNTSSSRNDANIHQEQRGKKRKSTSSETVPNKSDTQESISISKNNGENEKNLENHRKKRLSVSSDSAFSSNLGTQNTEPSNNKKRNHELKRSVSSNVTAYGSHNNATIDQEQRGKQRKSTSSETVPNKSDTQESISISKNNRENDKNLEKSRKKRNSVSSAIAFTSNPETENTELSNNKKNIYEVKRCVSSDDTNGSTENHRLVVVLCKLSDGTNTETSTTNKTTCEAMSKDANKIITANTDNMDKYDAINNHSEIINHVDANDKRNADNTSCDSLNNDGKDSSKEKLPDSDKANRTSIEALEETLRIIKENGANKTEKELPAVEIPGKKRKASKRNLTALTDICYKYACCVCTISFSYQKHCLEHMATNHKLENPTVPYDCILQKCAFCHICVAVNTYKNHIKSVHGDIFSKIIEQ